MRNHNPLQEPAPNIFTPAARFAFLIRRDGTKAVATGDFNVRVTQHATPAVISRLDAAAHVMRLDYEVQQISLDGYIYVSLYKK